MTGPGRGTCPECRRADLLVTGEGRVWGHTPDGHRGEPCDGSGMVPLGAQAPPDPVVDEVRPRRPFPSQLAALRAVADGCSLTQGAARLGIGRQALASRLSVCYSRLGVKAPRTSEDMSQHALSQYRRYQAIEVCEANGWWPSEHADGCMKDPDHTDWCDGDRGQL